MGYWRDVNGWDYLWMIGMMVVWAVIVVGGIWAVLTRLRSDGGRALKPPSAKEELDRRFARGEISEDEYLHLRDLISARH